MNALYPQDWRPYLGVLLVFFRLLGLFINLPGFSHRALPLPFKLLLGLSLSLVIHPLVAPYLTTVSDSLAVLVSLAIQETIIGLMMGFAANLTFEAFNLAAHLIGVQMGIGTASLMDPLSQTSTSLLVPFHGWLAIVLFFVADFHHEVLAIFISSFRITRELAPDTFSTAILLKYVSQLIVKLFLLAFQMAAPFTLMILGINTVMGILAKVMPQLNVFYFVFPVSILLGFYGLYLLAPHFLDFIDDKLHDVTQDMAGIIQIL